MARALKPILSALILLVACRLSAKAVAQPLPLEVRTEHTMYDPMDPSPPPSETYIYTNMDAEAWPAPALDIHNKMATFYFKRLADFISKVQVRPKPGPFTLTWE
jgi:hypothetical protein